MRQVRQWGPLALGSAMAGSGRWSWLQLILSWSFLNSLGLPLETAQGFCGVE